MLSKFLDTLLTAFLDLTKLDGFDLDNSEEYFGLFYMAYLTRNGAYYMTNYHFKFEIDRMRFNTFGGSKYTGVDGEKRAQMVITMLLIVRMFIVDFMFGLYHMQAS